MRSARQTINKGDSKMVAIIPLLAATIGGGLVSLVAFGPGVGSSLSNTLNALVKAQNPTQDELIRQVHLDKIDYNEYLRLSEFNGFNHTQAQRMLFASYNDLTPTEALTLYFRFMDDTENPLHTTLTDLENNLQANRMDPKHVNAFIEASRPVPNLDDIIRFAMRDVFEPEQARLAGLFENVPERFIHESKKRGLNEQEALWYWGAHWTIPSIHQAYEMLHRLFDHPNPKVRFTEKELQSYYQLADITPGMRQRLTEISYAPLTRVDVRRMYRLGVFGAGEQARKELIRRYRDIGYNHENASLLAEFTIRYESPDDREFSRSEILKYYKEGIFGEDGRNTASERLTNLGYDDQEVKWILNLADKELIDPEEQEQLEAIKERWLKGIIKTEAGLRSELSSMDLTNSQIVEYIKKWKTEKDKRLERLTRSDADKLFKAGIIDPKKYTDLLIGLNYTKDDINLLIQLHERPEGSENAFPSKADVLAWYGDEIISQIRFVGLMRDLGYNDEFIQYYAYQSSRGINEDTIEIMDIKPIPTDEELT